MDSYWDSSWEKIDEERLLQYINEFDLQPDEITAYLHEKQAKTVCDAGCGCGIYSLKLAANGFAVSSFDVSAHAVKIAQKLLQAASVQAELKTASILKTGYQDGQFDCVVSRDVMDHMSRKDAAAAMRELCRIVKPGGTILITLDAADSEYETEEHTVNADGDYLFTSGKWDGMIFHPYSEQEVLQMIPSGACAQIERRDEGFLVKLTRQEG